MYQKDFIMRMIEMLGDLIAGILAKIKKGDFPQASQSLNNAYSDFLKQDASFFRNIPINELTGKLLLEHKFTTGHLEILSELFYAEAELFNAENRLTQSLEYYEKALLLYEFVDAESNSFSFKKQSKISYVRSRVEELSGE